MSTLEEIARNAVVAFVLISGIGYAGETIMNFLSKFLHKKKPAKSGSAPARATPAVVPAGLGANAPAPDATGITTENIRDWCNRLEREANLTGNPRLRMQARNIRDRFGVA